MGGVTTYYVYDGTILVREMKRNINTGQLMNTATYLQGPRGPEYRRDDTPAGQEKDAQGNTVSHAQWYVYDGLGSVVGEVDAGGNLTSSPKYDVYGLIRSNLGSASSRQGFVGGLGHVSDTETGLIYMRARYYDPSIGRFSSEDTALDGLNWFVYCNDNPINKTDADGKSPVDLGVNLFLAATILFTTMEARMDGVLSKALWKGLMAAGGALIGAAVFGQSWERGCAAAILAATFAWATERFQPPTGGPGAAVSSVLLGVMVYTTILAVYSSTIGIET